jgi:hypothetical protein
MVDPSSAGSLYLDMREAAQDRAASDVTTHWVRAQVVDTPSTDPTLPDGWVRVGLPYEEPRDYLVGETPGIYTWKGAAVTVKMHADGTLLSISDGQDEPGDEKASVERLGPAGRELAQAMDDAVKARKVAKEVEGRADAASKDAQAAGRDARAAKADAEKALAKATTVEGAASDLSAKVTAAQTAAQQAQSGVDAAQRAAQDAASKAQAALDAVKKSGDNAAALAAATEAKQAAEAAKTLAVAADKLAQDAKTAAQDAASKAQAADTVAKRADASAAAVKSTADSAASAAAQAQAEAQAATAQYDALKATVTANSTELAKAKSAADEAQRQASAAKSAADAATADALGARQAADAASARASTLAGQVTVAHAAPTAGDAAGKPKGAVWFVQDGTGQLTSQYAWDGAAWSLMPVSGSALAPQTITAAQIGRAAIGEAQIADASITDAKIGGLSVSKLMVTGGAKMPRAVIDVLLSDQAFIRALAANSVTVDPENMIQDSGLTGRDVWSLAPAGGATAAFVSDLPAPPGGAPQGVRMKANGGSVVLTQALSLPAGKRWTLRLAYRYSIGSRGGLTVKLGGPLVCNPPYVDDAWKTEEWVWEPANSVAAAQLTIEAGAGTTVELHSLSLTEQVGTTRLAPGSVTADCIYASREMWAKMAAFGSVTTEMLTAGNATIPGKAVVGDLVGNNLTGVTIRGGAVMSYSESAESRNKKLQGYQARDGSPDWYNKTFDLRKAAIRNTGTPSQGEIKLTSATETEWVGSFSTDLEDSFWSAVEVTLTYPDGFCGQPEVEFVVDSPNNEWRLDVWRGGSRTSHAFLQAGYRSVLLPPLSPTDTQRTFSLMFHPGYKCDRFSIRRLKYYWTAQMDTTEARLQSGALLVRSPTENDRLSLGKSFLEAGQEGFPVRRRHLLSAVAPWSFTGTATYWRTLTWRDWRWATGNLGPQDTITWEDDCQWGFVLNGRGLPYAQWPGLYMASGQCRIQNRLADNKWVTVEMQVAPDEDWDNGLSSSVCLEPGVTASLNVAGHLSFRRKRTLHWRYAIVTPGSFAGGGDVKIDKPRLTAAFLEE